MNIIIKTAKDAIKLLEAVKSEYTIKLVTGEVFSNASPVAPPAPIVVEVPATRKGRSGKRRRKFAINHPGVEWGAMSQYVKARIANMNVSDVEVIPAHPSGEFSAEDLRKNISMQACTKWGNDAHKTLVRDDGGVEILRTK